MGFLESCVCWVVNTKFAEGSSRSDNWTLRFYILDGYRYNRCECIVLNNEDEGKNY